MNSWLLADDHVLVRAGLKALLKEHFQTLDPRIGEVGSGEEAIDYAREHAPDLILMDLNMPGIGGMEACRRILQTKPKTKILVVTAVTRDPYPRRLIETGVHGYLTKFSPPEDLYEAVGKILKGGRYVAADVARQLALELASHSEKSPLQMVTQREMQVLLMLARGESIRAISDKLCLSPKTVATYRYRLYDKLGCANDVELTRAAIRYGVVEIEGE